MELEIHEFGLSSDSEKTQREKVDSLQEVGLPIAYDAFREIPLPKSPSTHEQLKAFLLLTKAQLMKISPLERVGIHLNIGGIKRLDSNLFLLHFMNTAANLTLETSGHYELWFPLGSENEHWAKPLYEDDEKSPHGLPFRIRTNGVIEFRWVAHYGITNYNRAVKGFETFVYACEAIAAWQKVQDSDPGITEKDHKLAAIWEKMKTEALKLLNGYGLRGAEFDFFYANADKCAELEWQIVQKTAQPSRGDPRGENQQKMYNVFLEGRKEVKQILRGS